MDKALHYELLFRGLKDKYGQDQMIPMFNALNCAALDGGEGSGNFGHAGRPGQVGGSAKSAGSSNFSITEEEAIKLLSSNWVETIKNAIAKLPKAKNGRPYITNGSVMVDVPQDFVGETKKEILKKSQDKNERIAALWAVNNIEELFRNSILTETSKDKHNRPSVKNIFRFEVAFPLQIEEKIFAFNTKFTVREFEDGRNILSSELLEVNKGLDFGLYAMSIKK